MACAGQFYCEFLDEETDNGGQLVDIGFGGQEYKAVIHEFEESADIAFIKGWYQTQVICHSDHGNCLQMHHLDVSERRAITDGYKGSLSTWWSNIRDELIQIFQPIFATLKNMFLEVSW
ncbi:hypothetical protein S245_022132 [Arachis hypogaea]